MKNVSNLSSNIVVNRRGIKYDNILIILLNKDFTKISNVLEYDN